MTMLEVETHPCLGCGQTAFFFMTQEQYNAWKQGTHVQRIFPDWSPEDREMLISGTCPNCWEEMFPEEDEEEEPYSDDYEEWLYEVHGSVLDPESDYPEYESDYYVSESDESDYGQPGWFTLAADRDCD